MSNQKRMIAKSHADYRGVTIMETENGCSFVLNGKQFDCKDLNEAVAAIDAAAVRAVEKILLPGAHWVGDGVRQLHE